MDKTLRIEVTKKVMAGNAVLRKNRVVESDDPTMVAEYQGLINSGYARKTTKALNEDGDVAESGKPFDAAAIVDGSVADVTERLSGLDAKQLAAVGKAEAAGKDRIGVHSAIEAANAAIAPPAE